MVLPFAGKEAWHLFEMDGYSSVKTIPGRCNGGSRRRKWLFVALFQTNLGTAIKELLRVPLINDPIAP
jgi:hypothetical protein